MPFANLVTRFIDVVDIFVGNGRTRGAIFNGDEAER